MKKEFNPEAATLRVLSAYYRNDIALFLRHTANRFLLASPECRPAEQTAESMKSIHLFSDQTFRRAVRKATAPLLSRDQTYCSVLLTFTLDVYQKEVPYSQKLLSLLACWQNQSAGPEPSDWRITVFMISEAGVPDPYLQAAGMQGSSSLSRDGFVAEKRTGLSTLRRNLIPIKGNDHSIHFLEKDDIIWVESNHLHSIIHTHSGIVHTNTTLSKLAEGPLSCLYRPHVSYLVNPRFIYQIGNAQMTMTDGAVIPIPERHFSRVKKELTAISMTNF